MEMTKDAIGISNYRTYSNTLNDLIEWWFIKEIQKSKNQYSSTIIAIVENTEANTKALDKALQKHSQKQSISTVYGTVCIDKQETINQEHIEPYPEDTKNKEIQNTKYNKEEWEEFIKEEWFASYTARVLIDKWWNPDMTTKKFTEWIATFMQARSITYSESDYQKWKWAFQSMFSYWDEQDKWSRKKKIWLARMTNQKWFNFNLPFTKK